MLFHTFTSFAQLNYTTILYLTNKELNKESLTHLENLLREQSTNNDNESATQSNHFLNGQLFGDRECVQQLLNTECKFLP